MSNLQEQGRAHYKHGDYQKAIALFDRAIGRAGTASVQLLDNRAACYEKLDDLPAALKDAKKAIQLHRENVTGYLRAGKILMKMEKQSVALEIYTHGLKCIKHVGQGYELLRKVHKELMDQLSPPKSVDPLTVLPREIAELILDYLTFRQRMNACLVSKQWTHFIRSAPNLWQHLDLSLAQKKVRSAFISRAINVGRSKLTTATLRNLYDFDKTVAALVKHCPLEELILVYCGYQSRNLVDLLRPAKRLKKLNLGEGTHFSANEFQSLLSTTSVSLESIECTFEGQQSWPEIRGATYPKLTSMSMKFDDPNLATIFDNVQEHIPALQSLTLDQNQFHVLPRGDLRHDLSKCTQLRRLDIFLDCPKASLFRLPPGLIALRLAPMRLDRAAKFFKNMVEGDAESYFLPCLEDLTVEASEMPIDHVICVLDDGRPQEQRCRGPETVLSKLRKLSIHSAQSSPESIERLLAHPRLKEIECLSLSRTRDCNDETVSKIVKALPKLRSLTLDATDITGVAVKAIVTTRHIDQLRVGNCRFLGRDAVEWAQAQGVAVQYRMHEQVSGGRKVRY